MRNKSSPSLLPLLAVVTWTKRASSAHNRFPVCRLAATERRGRFIKYQIRGSLSTCELSRKNKLEKGEGEGLFMDSILFPPFLWPRIMEREKILSSSFPSDLYLWPRRMDRSPGQSPLSILLQDFFSFREPTSDSFSPLFFYEKNILKFPTFHCVRKKQESKPLWLSIMEIGQQFVARECLSTRAFPSLLSCWFPFSPLPPLKALSVRPSFLFFKAANLNL